MKNTCVTVDNYESHMENSLSSSVALKYKVISQLIIFEISQKHTSKEKYLMSNYYQHLPQHLTHERPQNLP